MLIEESDQGFFPGEDGLITESEARNLVLAAGYETGVHPDYDRRSEIRILIHVELHPLYKIKYRLLLQLDKTKSVQLVYF